MIVEPMLAAPMPKKPVNLAAGEYVAEEKFDGHRVIVHIAYGKVIAWSRLGNVKPLPQHLEAMRDALPSGIYDGELLVPGKRSYNVTELDEFKNQVFMAFDMLHVGNFAGDRPSLIGSSYSERRAALEAAFDYGDRSGNVKRGMRFTDAGHDAWQLPPLWEVRSTEDVTKCLSTVWQRDGEGLILKRRDAIYEPGKRPKLAWIKMKALRSDVFTLVGYVAGKMGPQATQLLEDAEGNRTTVKWKNMELLSRFNANPQAFIGRKVRVEYQERTSDGNYRHPRWDRFEDE